MTDSEQDSMELDTWWSVRIWHIDKQEIIQNNIWNDVTFPVGANS